MLLGNLYLVAEEFTILLALRRRLPVQTHFGRGNSFSCQLPRLAGWNCFSDVDGDWRGDGPQTLRVVGGEDNLVSSVSGQIVENCIFSLKLGRTLIS
jgi:hypothetical protein